jgi:hypothetical protein
LTTSEVEAMLYKITFSSWKWKGERNVNSENLPSPYRIARLFEDTLRNVPSLVYRVVKVYSPDGGLRMQVPRVSYLPWNQAREEYQTRTCSFKTLTLEDFKAGLHSDPRRQRKNVDHHLPLQAPPYVAGLMRRARFRVKIFEAKA